MVTVPLVAKIPSPYQQAYFLPFVPTKGELPVLGGEPGGRTGEKDCGYKRIISQSTQVVPEPGTHLWHLTLSEVIGGYLLCHIIVPIDFL
jgi:hypothetical protein